MLRHAFGCAALLLVGACTSILGDDFEVGPGATGGQGAFGGGGSGGGSGAGGPGGAGGGEAGGPPGCGNGFITAGQPCFGTREVTFSIDRDSGSEVAVGDCDEDGDIDILVSTFQAITALELDGEELIERHHFDLANGNVNEIALASINDDERPDLWAWGTIAGSDVLVDILAQPGCELVQGSFLVGTSGIWDIDTIDLDGDDLDDVVLAGYDSVRSMQNDAGSLEQTTLAGVDQGAGVGDLDGDSVDDLVYVDSGAASVCWAYGNGTDFDDGDCIPGLPAGPDDALVADLVGDGDAFLDAVVLNTYGNSVSVLLNDGAGTLELSESVDVGSPDGPVAMEPGGIALGDVDNDDDLDIVTANRAGDYNVSVLLNDGEGNFALANSRDFPLVEEDAPYPVVDANPTDVALGDIDGDGMLDIVVTYSTTDINGHSRVTVLFNNP